MDRNIELGAICNIDNVFNAINYNQNIKVNCLR